MKMYIIILFIFFNSTTRYHRAMFIKKALKTDPKTGKTYSAYHLVESVRTEKGPRQRTLLYMGAEVDLPEGTP